MINITAPGNALRQEVEVQMNPVKAILLSVEWGAIYAVSWTTPMVIVGFMGIAAAIWKLAGESRKNYINPIFAAIISFGIFSAMLTPTFYATSLDAPNRVKNIIGTALYVLIFVNIVNGFGYYRSGQAEGNKKQDSMLAKIMNITLENTHRVMLTCIALVMVIFLFPQDKNTYTSISAVRSIANGEAKRYYEENLERIELYNDESQEDIRISLLSDDARPYLLFKQDVTNEGGDGYWQIIQLCDYYNKNSIIVEE